jgi:hypothetical protein
MAYLRSLAGPSGLRKNRAECATCGARIYRFERFCLACGAANGAFDEASFRKFARCDVDPNYCNSPTAHVLEAVGDIYQTEPSRHCTMCGAPLPRVEP